MDPDTFVCPTCESASLFVDLMEFSEKDGLRLRDPPEGPNPPRVIGCWTCRGVFSFDYEQPELGWIARPDLARVPSRATEPPDSGL